MTKTAAFSSATFLASSNCASTRFNWSSNWSALSWSFSDSGRAASAFSASAIVAFRSAGMSFLAVPVSEVAPASAVADLAAWSLSRIFLSAASFASAFAASSFNSATTLSIEISPASIAANRSSFPIFSFNSLIAFSLSVIFLLSLIAFSASATNLSRESEIAFLVSASSLAFASAFASSSLALASACLASSWAVLNSASAAVFSASASFFALSASAFAALASASSFFSASTLVAAAVASVVLASTFAWASVTFSSAFLASASASWITFGVADLAAFSSAFTTNGWTVVKPAPKTAALAKLANIILFLSIWTPLFYICSVQCRTLLP